MKSLVLAFAFLPLLYGQDTRKVAEPRIPESCVELEARMSAPGGSLSNADEARADTARLQAAIDGCGAGKAVVLRAAGAKDVFLSGPLSLKSGVTLVVAARTALFASRNPRDYDVAPGSCGIVGERGPGCKTLITADRAPGSGVMGDGAIDGRGGAKLIGQNVSFWDLAKQAKVLDKYQAVPRLISVRQSNGFTLYRITLRNSPNFHVGVSDTDGFTAWGVKIRTPKTARNTDGIDPSSSTNVTIAYCDIDTGDDNVAVKTGSTPASHITIAHNHFYAGHGMSIGSGTAGGVSDVLVTDLSIDGADNGIRIKSDRSRGGLVNRVTYENVCMRNVANPIVLTSMYTTFEGDKLPVYRDILLENVHSLTPGWVTYLGVDAQHALGVRLRNVVIDGETAAQTRIENADVKTEAGGTAIDCSGRFPKFPQTVAPAAAETVPPEDATLYVAASGTGDYYSIQRAIDVAPAGGAVISIAPGTYRERLRISKPNIHLRSAYSDASKTVIVADESAGSTGSTFKSATVEVDGDNFTAENLTFANDYNRTHEQVSQGSQALALSVTGDRAVFRNMRLLGNQDTVYAASKGCSADGKCTPARQYFADCYIEGNVDFIFGDGKAVFEKCEIHSTPHNGGYITAQGKRFADEDSGFVLDHCKLTAAEGVKGVWLGRPWRPYAWVVFMNTEMGAQIAPGGWREWHPGETNYLQAAFYAEFRSTGPGGAKDGRDPHTRFLTAEEAARFEAKRFLAGADGWNPEAK